MEVERALVGRAFLGPADLIGFHDLTGLIERDGLAEIINPPSFSPWMNRGRVYGLPHDVHPVMLGYRADIVEAAGIDVSEIETWDDFIRVMSPLMADKDGDGKPDHYLLGIWETDSPKLEALMLQADGGYFTPDGALALATPANARVLAAVADWLSGPDRIADQVPDFTGSGNQLKVDGHAIAYLMPDWMCAIWRIEIPQLAGKVKVMPLPAWDRGGRRTSVWGGTMLGLSRTSQRIEDAWETAKELYISHDLARVAFKETDLISPVMSFWDDPMYDEPDPYFSGQAKGRMYIDLAPDIPRRVSSPFHPMVEQRMREAAAAVARYARANEHASREELEAKSMEELSRIQADVQRWMDRNAFAGGRG
jgi:arabinosaccharide transport system substrate-binding protein